MNSVYTERVIKESKRYIGEDLRWDIDEESYYADKVASFFLDILKKQVEKYYNGEKVEGAVITIPGELPLSTSTSNTYCRCSCRLR